MELIWLAGYDSLRPPCRFRALARYGYRCAVPHLGMGKGAQGQVGKEAAEQHGPAGIRTG